MNAAGYLCSAFREFHNLSRGMHEILLICSYVCGNGPTFPLRSMFLTSQCPAYTPRDLDSLASA